MKNKIFGVMGAVIVSGLVFYGGMQYAAFNINAKMQSLGGSGFSGGQRGGRNGGGIFGEVVSKDSQSLTIKLRDGGSKIVFITATVPVQKNVAGSLDDVKVGGQVSVMGTSNQDGSLSAQTIQIRNDNKN